VPFSPTPFSFMWGIASYRDGGRPCKRTVWPPRALAAPSYSTGFPVAPSSRPRFGLAEGESVSKYKSPLSVLRDTYDHSCY
jgi:hypothetical protein